MSYFPPPNSGKWTTGLCGCLSDLESCLCGACCPCVLIGRYVEILDQGATTCCSGGTVYCCLQSWTGCGFLFTCGYRSRLRQKFGLPASPCADCLTDCCCHHISVCQVYRELENRGIDPKLGYNGVRHIYEQPPQVPQQYPQQNQQQQYPQQQYPQQQYPQQQYPQQQYPQQQYPQQQYPQQQYMGK